ncbi:hypothetical protein Pflav_019290 [Phytohabitans flavus]|uniref:PAC2 family protein n=1 Tax=Phytohabitans flavus TaxID=1076124 RepID=A0A6F8XNZ8_9ACTN|nr:hypothetical protein Pflav_019290 [Phytohabitans flavus]
MAIAAFEGWNDAADASTAAVEHLEQVWEARQIAALDPEDFYDFQVSRPTITMADGETRRIEWPTTRFMRANPPGTDRDVVLIRGIEPSMRWRTFCEQVLELCHSLEIERVVLLGALLADVPYTRPLPISGSASDKDAAERYRLTPTRYDGPTGIVGVLQDACARAEVDAVSFWVHVPHYANNPPAPRPPRRCCTASRTCSTCRYRWPTWPRRRPSGSSGCGPRPSRTPSLASTCASLRSGSATPASSR